jgi:hypothetical protein
MKTVNGRTEQEKTPEGRLAAVARSLAIRMEKKHRQSGGVGPREPDYADFRDAFRPYLQRELLLARIDEARHTNARAITARVEELARELRECEESIPKEDRL